MGTATRKNCPVGPALLLLLLCANGSTAQTRRQVWADEFNGTAIDRSIWSFEYGPANDCVHYFTDRPENASVQNGTLRVIALRESYNGYDYTAALLKTSRSAYWRYGRIEARIKLPGTNGFVPAFWLMPEDDLYGWWPRSGEIDVMEHPTNQIDKIFGTVHTEAYNSFTGSGPRGGSIRVADAETAFHVYAVEWTPDKMDFYVDEQKCFTFANDHGGSAAWPFDRPFYLILSMGVGGGWVGEPGATSVFPAVMEVDYVRVYQEIEDTAICGADFVLQHSEGTPYLAPSLGGARVTWTVPSDARIVSGQGTPHITVDWGALGGDVVAHAASRDESYTWTAPVTVSPNYLRNPGFETGVKYWHKTGLYPAQAEFTLASEGVYADAQCLSVEVQTPGVNPWDAQLSQRDLPLEAGKLYRASFFARTTWAPSDAILIIVDSATFFPYASKTMALTGTWQQYSLDFTAPATAMASFHLDLGGHAGHYWFDDLSLTELEPAPATQIRNGDFSEGDTGWTFSTLWPAQATATVRAGEYAVSISQGGANVWDINVGQAGLLIEQGKRYTVSFDAYAAAPRTISPLVGRNSSPWTVYSGSQVFTLTATKRTYTYSFLMNYPTDNQARLGFDIGGSSIDVVFDNITLQ
ncbi:MAG: carbohydrate binding domain-containing protein [Phycisphaerae bacterium]|nr:carbohydrate binding domain-containing protein [Phycisphaerae bacterium]